MNTEYIGQVFKYKYKYFKFIYKVFQYEREYFSTCIHLYLNTNTEYEYPRSACLSYQDKKNIHRSMSNLKV